MEELKVINYSEYSINEEFIGGLFNFFKGLFKKMAAQIQKLNDDPNTIKTFVLNNLLNINSPNNIFKKELDDFAKNTPTPDNAACFKLIDSILNKNSGALGKQGIGTLLALPELQGDKQKVKRITIEFIINTARDQVSRKIGYDPKKLKDPNYITKLKIFTPTQATPGATAAPGNTTAAPVVPKKAEISDDAAQTMNGNYDSVVYNYTSMQRLYEKETTPPTGTTTNVETDPNIDIIKKWVINNIVNAMNAFAKAIKEDDIKAAVAKGGTSDYKVGDMVKYKSKTNNIFTKKIDKIEGDKYWFTDTDGKPFFKTKEDIIGKEEGGDDSESKEVVDLKTKLTTMKGNKEQMAKVLNYVNFISNTANNGKAFSDAPVT